MFKREAVGAPGGQPAVFRKKTYSLERFACDLEWFADHINELLAIYVGRGMEAELREAIMAGVAYENACRWCAFMHSEWARKVGLTDEQLRNATELEPSVLPPHYQAAIVYARRRAAEDFSPPRFGGDQRGDQREANQRGDDLAAHFDARSRDMIETLARFMTSANLMANSFDALLARLRGRPAPQSQLRDELILGGLFALGVPFGSIGLAILRRKGLFELAKDFVTFSEAFDWRVEQMRLPSIANAGDAGRAFA